MASVQLRRGPDDWEIFRSWELEVHRNTSPKISVISLLTSLREEWNAIIDKVTYAKALHKLKESIKDVKSESIQVRGQRLIVDDVKARISAWAQHRGPLRAYGRLIESLDRYIELLTTHIRCIQAVKREQSMLNMDGKPSGNERSWKYTTRLLNDAKARMNSVRSQLAASHSWLRGESSAQSSNRDGAATEPKDDDNGGRGRSSKKQNSSGAVRRGANVTDRSERAGFSATGGANGGTRAGGDGGGSDEEDSERYRRREPESKPNVDGFDEEGEKGDDDQRKSASPDKGPRKTLDGGKGKTTNAEQSDAHDSHVSSGEDPLYDLEQALVQNSWELQTPPRQSTDRLSSLPDYAASSNQDIRESRESPTTRISQQPGAYRYGTGVNEGTREASLPEARDDYQSSKAPKHTVAAAGGHGNPDDDSTSSGDTAGRSKSPPKGKGKRAGDDDADESRSSRNEAKRRKQKGNNEELNSTFDAYAGLEDLPRCALDYLEAALSPDRHLILSIKALHNFVKRLNEVYGEEGWYLVYTIEHYFDNDGKERTNESPWQDLMRRDFEKRWSSTMSAMASEDRELYQEQYERLDKAKAWHIIPPPEFGSVEGDLHQLKFWVVEAENGELHERWKQHVARLREIYGSDPANAEYDSWKEAVERVIEHGGVPRSPPLLTYPRVPSLGSLDGPLPGVLGNFRDLLQRKARKLGFDGDAPGVWNFMDTLGAGGYGHAGLWVKFDSAGKMIDRQVVKETYLKADTWDMENFWMPHTGAKELPREYYIGTKLAECEQAFNVLGPSCFTIHPTQYMYRLYMTFCPYGDLFTLMHSHGAFERAGYRDRDDSALTSLVPISVVWCVFEALASAACLMKNGCLPGDTARANWDTIYHRDIKLQNVFLDIPDKNVWRNIPVPRLADFGLAMEHTPFNVAAPRMNSVEVGTQLFRAPECERYDFKWLFPHYPYESAGDVFSIGQTLWALMARRHPSQYRFDNDMGPRDLPTPAITFYPQRLQDLVNRCLRSKPKDRIAAEELWWEIHNEVASFRGLRGEPLKSRGLAEDEVLQLRPDIYVSWAK